MTSKILCLFYRRGIAQAGERRALAGVLFLTILCGPFAYGFTKDSCLNTNKQFISRYFAGHTDESELDSFFDCIDDNIQTVLNHTETGNPNYYTQTELRRLMQYMGTNRAKAEQISQALIDLKAGLIGGRTNRLTLKEIAVCRKILNILRERMRAVRGIIPVLNQVLNKQAVSRKTLITTTDLLQTNLITLGVELSRLSFASRLSLLSDWPRNLNILGFSHAQLKYWRPSLALLDQWKQTFIPSSGSAISSGEWLLLLGSFARLSSLWFYHKRFLEGRRWLNPNVIQHTQHFLSYSLNLVRETHKQSGQRDILLSNLDELARKLWFLPHLSRPVFRLGLRSTFCFLLNPLTNRRPCKYEMDFEGADAVIKFSDLTFTVANRGETHEKKRVGENSESERFGKEHLEPLREYMNAWIRTENRMRQEGRLPPVLFGSPSAQLNRKLNVTDDGTQLVFYASRGDDIALMSYLNRHSHLTRLITYAYTRRENQPVDQELWNTMIKEWTVFAMSVYRDMRWQSFQRLGFQVFNHGDFLTSQSNGDGLLQEEEILELFSLFTSSLSAVVTAMDKMQDCRINQGSGGLYRLRADCVWSGLHQLSSSLFAGAPRLLSEFSRDEGYKADYMLKLREFYSEKEELSPSDLFNTFLFVYYQENTMEYLDKDRSQDLSVQELEPLLNVFEQILIDRVPLVQTKREAFAFMTYMFHYGHIPIFGDERGFSAPLRFSNWLLDPSQWLELRTRRINLLRTLYLLNTTEF